MQVYTQHTDMHTCFNFQSHFWRFLTGHAPFIAAELVHQLASDLMAAKAVHIWKKNCYCRRLRSLLLSLCYVFQALINSLECWVCMSALGLVLFHTWKRIDDWQLTTKPHDRLHWTSFDIVYLSQNSFVCCFYKRCSMWVNTHKVDKLHKVTTSAFVHKCSRPHSGPDYNTFLAILKKKKTEIKRGVGGRVPKIPQRQTFQHLQQGAVSHAQVGDIHEWQCHSLLIQLVQPGGGQVEQQTRTKHTVHKLHLYT